MSLSLGSILIVAGFALAFLAQIGMALHAFTGNLIQGLLCLVVPFYVYVYAKRHRVGKMLIRAWYAGLVSAVVGTMLLS